MNYICRNCGEYISSREYEKAKFNNCGCLYLTICLFFLSIILIPLALILWLLFKPKVKCPYCNATESLIPENSPIAIRLLKETGVQSETNNNKNLSFVSKDYRKSEEGLIGWIIIISIIIICNT